MTVCAGGGVKMAKNIVIYFMDRTGFISFLWKQERFIPELPFRLQPFV